jgi:predicted transcriptional regulator with HTH domain
MVSRRPYGHMFEGTIPLIGWGLVNELSKNKLSSIHKTLALLSLPRVENYPLVTLLLHSKYSIYPKRKWLIENAKVSTTTVMKNMSRAITTMNKRSFMWMSIPPPYLKT